MARKQRPSPTRRIAHHATRILKLMDELIQASAEHRSMLRDGLYNARWPGERRFKLHRKIGVQLYWLRRDCERFGIDAAGLLREIARARAAMLQTLGRDPDTGEWGIGKHPDYAEWPAMAPYREMKEAFSDLEFEAMVAAETMRRVMTR